MTRGVCTCDGWAYGRFMGEKVHGHHPACRESSHILQPIPPAGRQGPDSLLEIWGREIEEATRKLEAALFRRSVELLKPVDGHEGEGEQGQTRPSEDSEGEES